MNVRWNSRQQMMGGVCVCGGGHVVVDRGQVAVRSGRGRRC